MGTGDRPAGAPSNISRGGAIGDTYRPRSVEELRAIVAQAERIRVLGTRHSFNRIGESDALVSLAGLPSDVTVEDGTVSFGAGMTYGELAVALDEHGRARRATPSAVLAHVDERLRVGDRGALYRLRHTLPAARPEDDLLEEPAPAGLDVAGGELDRGRRRARRYSPARDSR